MTSNAFSRKGNTGVKQWALRDVIKAQMKRQVAFEGCCERLIKPTVRPMQQRFNDVLTNVAAVSTLTG